jgi:hypothetical protein
MLKFFVPFSLFVIFFSGQYLVLNFQFIRRFLVVENLISKRGSLCNPSKRSEIKQWIFSKNKQAFARSTQWCRDMLQGRLHCTVFEAKIIKKPSIWTYLLP